MGNGGSRTLWIGGAAVLIVLALVFIALNREPVELDPSSPEGVVQTYLQAMSDGDYETALSLIDPDEFEGCDTSDLARAATDMGSFTAAIGSAEVEGSRAFVDVSINQGERPGPFDPGGGGYPELYELEDIAGEWLITGDPWPYFRHRCEGAAE